MRLCLPWHPRARAWDSFVREGVMRPASYFAILRVGTCFQPKDTAVSCSGYNGPVEEVGGWSRTGLRPKLLWTLVDWICHLSKIRRMYVINNEEEARYINMSGCALYGKDFSKWIYLHLAAIIHGLKRIARPKHSHLTPITPITTALLVRIHPSILLEQVYDLNHLPLPLNLVLQISLHTSLLRLQDHLLPTQHIDQRQSRVLWRMVFLRRG